ncbi:uncharacterized protein [Lepisosteus oculatus]|uniref:uncharacterized protein isoform X2 n=1 Tax=Lepisosteus oculatus TaxID=7918 RepID=UPI0037155DF8
MAHPTSPTLVLLLLFVGQALAGPGPGLLPRASHVSACHEHRTLHHKLNAVEQRVEDAVGKLEAEVSILLDAIEDPEWSSLLDTAGPVIDILDSKGYTPL